MIKNTAYIADKKYFKFELERIPFNKYGHIKMEKNNDDTKIRGQMLIAFHFIIKCLIGSVLNDIKKHFPFFKIKSQQKTNIKVLQSVLQVITVNYFYKNLPLLDNNNMGNAYPDMQSKPIDPKLFVNI